MAASSNDTNTYDYLKGYPGYTIFSDGRIYDTNNELVKESIEAGRVYVYIGSERETVSILIAEHFVHNPNKKEMKFVFRKNGNKLDNRAENLYWGRNGDHMKHTTKQSLGAIGHISLEQYKKDGTKVATYSTISDAAQRSGSSESGMRKAKIRAEGRGVTTFQYKNGEDVVYIWKFQPKQADESVDVFVDMPNYPKYQISKSGKIRSKTLKKTMAPQKDSNGYMIVNLDKGELVKRGGNMKDKTKSKRNRKGRRVHRLVAKAFIPNDDPINRTDVNHIDGNKTNNDVSNLEWCTKSENMRHAVREGLVNDDHKCKSVTSVDIKGKDLKTYKSIKEAAADTKASVETIREICNATGRYKFSGGLKWRWTFDPSKKRIDLTKAIGLQKDHKLPNDIQITKLLPSEQKKLKYMVHSDETSLVYVNTDTNTWNPIPGHETSYKISKKGVVYSILQDKYIVSCTRTGTVPLYKNGLSTSYDVLTLVDLAYPSMTNSERVLTRTSVAKAIRESKQQNSTKRPILQCDPRWKVLKRFDGVEEAVLYMKNEGHSSYSSSHVYAACSDDGGNSYDYKWKYETDKNPKKVYRECSDDGVRPYVKEDEQTWKSVVGHSSYTVSKDGKVFSINENKHRVVVKGYIKLQVNSFDEKAGYKEELKRPEHIFLDAYFGGFPQDCPIGWKQIEGFDKYWINNTGKVYDKKLYKYVAEIDGGKADGGPRVRLSISGRINKTLYISDIMRITFPDTVYAPAQDTQTTKPKKRVFVQREYDNDDHNTWQRIPNYSDYAIAKDERAYWFKEGRDHYVNNTGSYVLEPNAEEKSRGIKKVTLKAGRLMRLTYYGGIREDMVGTFFPIPDADGYFINRDGKVYSSATDDFMKPVIVGPRNKKYEQVRLNIVDENGNNKRDDVDVPELLKRTFGDE